jgi:hypothetical protein
MKEKNGNPHFLNPCLIHYASDPAQFNEGEDNFLSNDPVRQKMPIQILPVLIFTGGIRRSKEGTVSAKDA